MTGESAAVVGVDVERRVAALDGGGEVTQRLFQLFITPMHLLHLAAVSPALLLHVLDQVFVGLDQGPVARQAKRCHTHFATAGSMSVCIQNIQP